MPIIRFAIENPVKVAVAVLLLVLFGLLSISHIPIQLTPNVEGTIITVTTTIVIFTLKIFDVVWVMTGGQFGTDVIATQFYRQSFIARNSGFGSAIAIILLVAVLPVMVYNLRQFRQQEAF